MNRYFPLLVSALVLCWCLTVLLSWLLSAMMVPGVRPLLSGEGLRWLFAHSSSMVCRPSLSWLLMGAMAYGCLSSSGLLSRGGRPLSRRGLRAGLLVLLPFLVAIALLTLPPHAVLLSATGTLAGSPFSRAVVPLVCLAVVLFTTAYAVATRRLPSLPAVVGAMAGGLAAAAPLIIIYVVAAVLVQTLRYVFY